MDPKRILFIHGSDSNGQTYKAAVLRQSFPQLLSPDFTGTLGERMAQLQNILGDRTGWTIIGSSLGGLMAALFATQHPGQVRKLVLLAPALTLPEFVEHPPLPVTVPTVVIQGKRDDLLPVEDLRRLVEVVFINLEYILVDDDHRLHKTAEELDWGKVLA